MSDINCDRCGNNSRTAGFTLCQPCYDTTVKFDPTEPVRRNMVANINANPGSREALEAEHGQVWNTQELGVDFDVISFLAPFVEVCRRSDGASGTMMFQHRPRFYYGFKAK